MISTHSVLTFFLIFVRMSAVMMTAPIFSNRSIPAITKIGFAGLLSLIPASLYSRDFAPMPTDLFPFLLIVAQEVLVGVVIGFVSNLVFIAVSMAASLMGIQIGFGAASLFTPFLNIPTSALQQFYMLLVVALFLTIDGHHWLITALVRTFEVVPPGTFVLDKVTMQQLSSWTSEMFVTAAQISLPMLATLLLADFGLGLIARAVPQIQVFFIGLPIKIGLGYLVLAFTMSLMLPVIKELLLDMVANILVIGRP
jgi:flagellar biosynthesis protein FliR